MSVVGSDAFEEAPLLPFGEYGAPTPAASLTVDAVDTSWGLTRTAWWKVVVPASYDPAAGPIRVLMDAATTYPSPTGRPPEAFIWTGTDAATRVDVNWGVSVDLPGLNPGDTFYVEAVQWEQSGVDPAEYDSWTYRVVAGAVTYSYTGWMQGPTITTDFVGQDVDHGDVRVATASFADGIKGGAYDGALNVGLNWLPSHQEFNSPTGAISDPQDYTSSLYVEAVTLPADRETATVNDGTSYHDMGMYVGSIAAMADMVSTYQSTLTLPDDGQAYVSSELEGYDAGAFTVLSATYRVYLQSSGPEGGAPLVVETYVRPAIAHDDTSGSATQVDKHTYSSPELRTIEFTTSALGPGHAVHIFPIINFTESLPWSGTAPSPRDLVGGIESHAGNGVWLQDANPASPGTPRQVEIGVTALPPRHRFKIEHFLATTTRRAHLRQYPRSPLRHWPPERSVQRSNRRAGGYR